MLLRLPAILLLIAANLLTLIPCNAQTSLDFNQDIRPLLSDRCFACHGPDAAHRQASLRLDDPAAATQWAIVPGDAAASEVISRVTSADPDLVMPPPEVEKPLTPQEIATLTQWINDGAAYAAHWAYVAPQSNPPPQSQTDWARRNWIDDFVFAKLASHDLQPQPAASPTELVRRLTFDLHGLPPTPAQVAAFVEDPSDKNYEQLVDQLLASPRFGERFAIIWLDLVRYADTVGYHGDQDHSIAPYRDWVIDALNINMPFDQFTREQLAGDLLPNPTIDQLIATGYNRLLQTSHEGGVQPKEYLAIYAADRVRNVSAVWLGATLGCAQCHDHKYDPFTTRDFYSMAAFFADIDEERHFTDGSNDLPTKRAPEIDVLRPQERILVAQLEQRIEKLRSLLTGSEQTQKEDPLKDHQQDFQELSITDPTDRKSIENQLHVTEQTLASVQASARRTMITQAKPEPRVTRILPRGNWLDDSGEIVTPNVPQFYQRPLHNTSDTMIRPTRLDLANWLVDVEHGVGGLTARVMANRIWGMLLGSGISKSLDDFGGQGRPPANPELLDNLAIAFYESGWDIKSLIKQIVLSQTYRQSSHATPDERFQDPDNQWFGRQARYRLPAEMIRDNALAISGLLVLDTGGKSARPYQPTGYYRHLNFPPRKYQADQDQNQYRRGVYVHWQRQFLHPMLRAFDAPSREECTAQRPRSNTPLAALVLLNDPTFLEAAKAFATKLLLLPAADDDERLRIAFAQTVSRSPDEYELSVMRESLTYQRQRFQAHPEEATKLLSVGMFDAQQTLAELSVDEPEIAAWTEVARILLNLNEGMVRP